jgi:uncharacterized protein YoxC
MVFCCFNQITNMERLQVLIELRKDSQFYDEAGRKLAELVGIGGDKVEADRVEKQETGQGVEKLAEKLDVFLKRVEELSNGVKEMSNNAKKLNEALDKGTVEGVARQVLGELAKKGNGLVSDAEDLANGVDAFAKDVQNQVGEKDDNVVNAMETVSILMKDLEGSKGTDKGIDKGADKGADKDEGKGNSKGRISKRTKKTGRESELFGITESELFGISDDEEYSDGKDGGVGASAMKKRRHSIKKKSLLW